jgi:hypothetical protein
VQEVLGRDVRGLLAVLEVADAEGVGDLGAVEGGVGATQSIARRRATRQCSGVLTVSTEDFLETKRGI